VTPRWTQRRLDAVISAVAAMLAGEEGKGDWPPDVTADELRGGLYRLQAELARLQRRRRR